MKYNNENHNTNNSTLSGHYPPILDLLSQDYPSIASRLDREPCPFFIFSESFVRSVVWMELTDKETRELLTILIKKDVKNSAKYVLLLCR